MINHDSELVTILKTCFSKSIFNYSGIDFKNSKLFNRASSIFFEDYKRYFPNEEVINYNKFLNTIPLQAILTYRIANLYYQNGEEDSAILFSNLGRFLSGIEIYYSATIGRGLKINHGVGTTIGARCIIGENVLIHQNVTLGDKNGKRPMIEDNVIIYAGAIIIGGIKIGKNSIIGANSVVIKDIPANCRAAGIPAKILL